ncbi:MAG: transposase [Candidatus Desulforudis sp.]|nr:transposase [Desulforudis sp.]
MPRLPREKSKSGYYHIMLRGNERKNIFHDEDDKLRFIETLYNNKQEKRFSLHAFCLMDNHVHLMLSEGEEEIANLMKRVNISYVNYFNKKYERVGHLFQDRFRSEVVDEDSYVLALARYIHQNPVRAGMVKSAGEYKWSSYACYLDENDFSKLVETETVLELLASDKRTARKRFEEYMNEEAQEVFIDLVEDVRVMDEKTAKELFERMLRRGHNVDDNTKVQVSDNLIKEFKEKTNLSIRKIAAITGLNKDRVNKMLKS